MALLYASRFQSGYCCALPKGDLVLDERMILLSSPLPEGDYVIRLGVYNYTSGARLYVQPNSVSDDYVLLKFTVPHVN